MLELVIGLGMITFIYAYMYSQIPKENAWYKLLFFALTFFSIIFLIWVMLHSGETKTIEIYNNESVLTGTEIHTIALPTPIKEGITTYMGITIYALVFIFGITMILFAFDVLKSAMEKKKKKKDIKIFPILE